MNYFILLILLCAPIVLSITSRHKDDEVTGATIGPDVSEENTDHTIGNMKLTIGSAVFTATLFDNPAVATLKQRLPLTMTMVELNSNEKYCDLPDALPTNASKPGTIRNGDLMLYGSRTIVLFYKTFSTSYPYTPLGRIDNPEGLAAALGSGNVTVRFEIR